MRLRLVSTILAVPLAVGVLLLGGWPFWLVTAALLVGSTLEGERLLRAGGWPPERNMALGFGVLLALSLSGGRVDLWPLWFLGLAMLYLGRPPTTAFPVAVATGLLGLYPGALFGFWFLLRQEFGGVLVLYTFAGVWAHDILAYLGGRYLGRHPFSRLSPKKTWEGALFGLAGALGLWCLAGWGLGLPWSYRLGLGLVTTIGAVGGDLWESALKRFGGLKDSGRFLPGHGGFLDRLDGVLFALPLVYYLLSILKGAG